MSPPSTTIARLTDAIGRLSTERTRLIREQEAKNLESLKSLRWLQGREATIQIGISPTAAVQIEFILAKKPEPPGAPALCQPQVLVQSDKNHSITIEATDYGYRICCPDLAMASDFLNRANLKIMNAGQVRQWHEFFDLAWAMI